MVEVMTSTSQITAAVHGTFDPDDESALDAAVSSFLESLDSPPALLALGEATHAEPAFAHVRNRLFQVLVQRGFRSIAVESDQIAALKVNAFIHDGPGTLDQAMAEGFSHGFGEFCGNRQLVAWMREYNHGRPAGEQLAFHGFDAPMEMMSVPSPRRFLRLLHDYLTGHLGPDSFLHGRADLQELLGDDQRWSDTEAVLNAEKSVGASSEAAALRVIADDLLTTLSTQAPRLVAASSIAEWRRAETHGRAARGLLRYHSQAAGDIPDDRRWTRMSAVRDALMVENLTAVRAVERHRGPTLLSGHNLHFQRNRSAMNLGPMELEWFSAGAIADVLLEERYAFIATSLGESTAIGLQAPPANTFEHAMQRATDDCALFDAGRLHHALGDAVVRTDTEPEQGYFPLEAATLAHCDAVLHIAASKGHRANAWPG